MRVATLLSFPVSHPGGISTFVTGLHTALAHHHPDIETRLIAPDTFRAGPGEVADQVRLAAQQLGQLNTYKPDVVHVHDHPVLLAAAVAYTAQARHAVHIVYTVHIDPPTARRLAKRLLLGVLLARCQAVTVVSHDTARKLGRVSLPVPGRLEVVYGAADAPNQLAPEVRTLRERLRVGDGPLLCQVAPMNFPLKVAGLECLVAALPIVRQRYPGTRLVLVGDGHLRRQLERACRRAGVADAVTITGYVQDVSSLLALADVYCHISLQDACPLSLLEAMHAGKPIVAARCGGIPELITDTIDGLLVKPQPASTAAAIIDLLQHPQHAQRLAERAQKTAQQRFTWRRVAADFAGIYARSARGV